MLAFASGWFFEFSVSRLPFTVYRLGAVYRLPFTVYRLPFTVQQPPKVPRGSQRLPEAPRGTPRLPEAPKDSQRHPEASGRRLRYFNFLQEKSDFGPTTMDPCSGYSKSYYFSSENSKSALGRFTVSRLPFTVWELFTVYYLSFTVCRLPFTVYRPAASKGSQRLPEASGRRLRYFNFLQEKCDFGPTIMDPCSGYSESY